MGNNTTTARPRDIQLDFLRGIAILLVIGYHSPMHNVALGRMAPVLDPLISFGWAGVPLFFVLSGFLVGGLLFKEIRATGRVDVGRFLIRRAFKIWPAYFAFVIYFYVKLVHRKEGFHGAFMQLWPNFLQIQNYFPTPPHHTWSLAVEEHFYVGFAILIFLLMRAGGPAGRRLKVIPWIAFALLVVCLCFRLMNWNKPFDNFTDMWETHLCVDALFLGVFIGYLYHFYPEIFERWTAYRPWLISFAIAANIPIFIFPKTSPWVFTFGLTLMSLGYACLLIGVAPAPSRREPIAGFWTFGIVRLVAWVGLYSYSIYLWQLDLATQPLLTSFPRLWQHGPVTCQAAIYLTLDLAFSVIAGVIMAKVIEFPALNLRDRLFPSVGRRPQPVAASIPANAAALPSLDSLS